ncbi:MAG: efflux RND transporter permease subunit [Polyangiales bacterium]
MMERLLALCAKHRAIVLVLAVALALAGVHAMKRVRLDAVPDLSDPQVIVFAEWMGRSPTVVEDQVTYPLVTALLGLPQVADVRAQTMFGMAFVYVVFEEGADLDRARSRVLEQLNTARNRLPAEVSPRIGPDASGVGWVYQYALVDRSGRHDLADLRAYQDYTLRYALAAVPGVAEVATVGGYEAQYQVTLDPARLRAQGVSWEDVTRALRRASGDVGGRVIEMAQREYYVRGLAQVRSAGDLESVVLREGRTGAAPVRVRDVASVRVGAEIRRGSADLDGRGEVVSGVVVMRQGENAREVIARVEQRLRELRSSLPEGVTVVTAYDRSQLITRAIDTLRRSLTEEMVVVALVIALFLLHVRSALLPILSLPLVVLTAFIPMYLLKVPATIMSLGGIAIAIGATVDAEIVMVEAAHKKLEHVPPDLPHAERAKLLAEAAAEVTPAIFFSLLIVAASFIPVFGLEGQAGRLFRPLALTKTFVMLSAALLSVTVAPALRDYLLQGNIRAESAHPVSRAIRAVYGPFVHVALRNPGTTVLIGVMAVLSALPIAARLGSEFMPPLDEGDILYMPTTLPGISIEEARRQLQRQDAILREVPEVEAVLGKAGRAETPTDPAPLAMFETVVKLKPRAQWRTAYVRRWYVGTTPVALRPLLNRLWPEFVPMSREALVADLDRRLRLPGWTNAFTQPIRNRVDMLATGIRTPVGVKVYAHDLAAIERAGTALERVLHGVPGTRSVLYERSTGGYVVDVTPDRAALARVGLSVDDLNGLVEGVVGGAPVATVLDGRRRITVSARFAEDFRASPDALRALAVPLGEGGRTVPLGSVARVEVRDAPPMLRDEAGMLVGYVYVDVDASRDLGHYLADARRAVDVAVARGEVRVPAGGWVRWTGQYELLAAMEARMKVLIPLTLAIVVVLLYLQFRNLTEALIVLLSVPFALVGSVWALYLLDYNLSTAVWVGVIALVGLAAQTGVVMIVYIDHAYEKRLREGRIRSLEDIVEAHAEGTIQRVRPKLMTVGTMLFGVVPLLWSEGAGADVMKRIAAPMAGGLATSAFLTLEIIPVVYTYWRFEQLVWREAEARMDPRLGALVALARGAGGALAACAASLAARVYVATPAWWPWVTWAALGGALAALAGYVALRRGVARAMAA